MRMREKIMWVARRKTYHMHMTRMIIHILECKLLDGTIVKISPAILERAIFTVLQTIDRAVTHLK